MNCILKLLVTFERNLIFSHGLLRTFLISTLSKSFQETTMRKLYGQELRPLLNIPCQGKCEKGTVSWVYVIGAETIRGKNPRELFCILFFVFMKDSFPPREEMLTR